MCIGDVSVCVCVNRFFLALMHCCSMLTRKIAQMDDKANCDVRTDVQSDKVDLRGGLAPKKLSNCCLHGELYLRLMNWFQCCILLHC